MASEFSQAKFHIYVPIKMNFLSFTRCLFPFSEMYITQANRREVRFRLSDIEEQTNKILSQN